PAGDRRFSAQIRAPAAHPAHTVPDAHTFDHHWHDRMVLAKDMGFTGLNWPQYAWIAAAVTLVVLMAIQGLGYLLPTNLRVCLELQRNNPDPTKIASLTNRYFMAVATRGVMQVATIVIMARLATGI